MLLKLYWLVIILLIKIYNTLLGDKVREYRGIKLYLTRNIFSPVRTISTGMILDYLDKLDLADKHVCDLGTGSGVIAIFCAKKSARVVASDISPIAVRVARINSYINNVKVDLRQCDLFQCYSENEKFDIIIFNPPYFPVRVNNFVDAMYASGENYSTIIRFLLSSKKKLLEGGFILITLTSLIDIDLILGIARKIGYSVEKILERDGMPLEKLFLYKLSLVS